MKLDTLSTLSTQFTAIAAMSDVSSQVCKVTWSGPCPAGYFNPSANITDNSKIARLCTPVGVGYFSKESDDLRQACPRGMFADSDTGRRCYFCGSGSYSNKTASAICQPCPAGTFSPSQGAWDCQACDPTFYHGPGANYVRRQASSPGSEPVSYCGKAVNGTVYVQETEQPRVVEATLSPTVAPTMSPTANLVSSPRDKGGNATSTPSTAPTTIQSLLPDPEEHGYRVFQERGSDNHREPSKAAKAMVSALITITVGAFLLLMAMLVTIVLQCRRPKTGKTLRPVPPPPTTPPPPSVVLARLTNQHTSQSVTLSPTDAADDSSTSSLARDDFYATDKLATPESRDVSVEPGSTDTTVPTKMTGKPKGGNVSELSSPWSYESGLSPNQAVV
jgi:Tyrosine-protein kinase ephrin type A/B receptor-like